MAKLRPHVTLIDGHIHRGPLLKAPISRVAKSLPWGANVFLEAVHASKRHLQVVCSTDLTGLLCVGRQIRGQSSS